MDEGYVLRDRVGNPLGRLFGLRELRDDRGLEAVCAAELRLESDVVRHLTSGASFLQTFRECVLEYEGRFACCGAWGNYRFYSTGEPVIEHFIAVRSTGGSILKLVEIKKYLSAFKEKEHGSTA